MRRRAERRKSASVEGSCWGSMEDAQDDDLLEDGGGGGPVDSLGPTVEGTVMLFVVVSCVIYLQIFS